MSRNEVLTLDLTNYKERRSAHVPEGTYRVRVADWEIGKAQSSGNQMMTLWLEIIDDPDPNINGSLILDRLVATEKAAFRVVHFLKAVGMDPNVGGQLRLPGRAVMGRTLLVEVVDDDPYQGRVKSIVSEYMVDPEAGKRAAAAAAASELPMGSDDIDDLPMDPGEARFEAPHDHHDDVTGYPASPEDDDEQRAEQARARVSEATQTDAGVAVDLDEVKM